MVAQPLVAAVSRRIATTCTRGRDRMTGTILTFMTKKGLGAICIAALFLSPSLSAEQLTFSSLEITSARPLFEALGKVQADLHVPVNFEEVPYQNSSDLIQGRGPVLKGTNLFPKGRDAPGNVRNTRGKCLLGCVNRCCCVREPRFAGYLHRQSRHQRNQCYSEKNAE